jgi:hypothetical protein
MELVLKSITSPVDIPKLVKEDGVGRYVERMKFKRNSYRILTGKPEGKRPLGITRPRWEDNIKMYLRKI